MNWADVDSLRDGVDKRGMKTTGTSDTELTDWVLWRFTKEGGKRSALVGQCLYGMTWQWDCFLPANVSP
jgi:hypothetical protein